MLLVFSGNISAQDVLQCEKDYNTGEVFQLTGKFDSAIYYYHKVTKNNAYWNNHDLFLGLAESYASINSYKEADSNLRKLVLMGESVDDMETIKEFEGYKKSEYWKNLYKDYSGLHKQFYNSINVDYLIDLKKFEIWDQSMRIGHLFHYDHSHSDSVLGNIENRRDSVVLGMLIEDIKKYGWPSDSLVGCSGYGIAFLLIWHHRDEYDITAQWKFLIPIINQEIKKGILPPYYLARFDDFRLTESIQKQKFGTRIFLHEGESQAVIEPPIEDIANVDKRREEIGLPPLWQEAIIENLRLPAEYRK
jgi:hypothetical protein